MELIVATRDGRELGFLPYDADMEAGGNNDFVIEIPRAAWTKQIEFEQLVYVTGTEFGGIIGEIQTMTDPEMVYCKGYLWRGLLQKKIICPPSGQDYYTISGDANSCIRQLITNIYNDPLMRGCEDSAGVTITSFQFDRYTDLLSGMIKMLKSVDYKLQIQYLPEGTGGYVEVGAVPIENYEATIEFSEDDEITLVTDEIRNGVNHLVCLGQGELALRTVVDLYADEDGNISQNQTFYGRDEITDVFENTAAESEAELISTGTERFLEVMNSKRFDASAGRITTNLQIGDIISGRDYTTGINVVKPIERKILKIIGGEAELEYRLEGES